MSKKFKDIEDFEAEEDELEAYIQYCFLDDGKTKNVFYQYRTDLENNIVDKRKKSTFYDATYSIPYPTSREEYEAMKDSESYKKLVAEARYYLDYDEDSFHIGKDSLGYALIFASSVLFNKNSNKEEQEIALNLIKMCEDKMGYERTRFSSAGSEWSIGRNNIAEGTLMRFHYYKENYDSVNNDYYRREAIEELETCSKFLTENADVEERKKIAEECVIPAAISLLDDLEPDEKLDDKTFERLTSFLESQAKKTPEIPVYTRNSLLKLDVKSIPEAYRVSNNLSVDFHASDGVSDYYYELNKGFFNKAKSINSVEAKNDVLIGNADALATEKIDRETFLEVFSQHVNDGDVSVEDTIDTFRKGREKQKKDLDEKDKNALLNFVEQNAKHVKSYDVLTPLRPIEGATDENKDNFLKTARTIAAESDSVSFDDYVKLYTEVRGDIPSDGKDGENHYVKLVTEYAASIENVSDKSEKELTSSLLALKTAGKISTDQYTATLAALQKEGKISSQTRVMALAEASSDESLDDADKKKLKEEESKVRAEAIDNGEIDIPSMADSDSFVENLFKNLADDAADGAKKFVYETKKHSLSTSDWYKSIIGYAFEGSNIIDIVGDYGWTNNSITKIGGKAGNYEKTNNIPFCFVTEYRQLYNSSITNILTSLIGLLSGATHATENLFDIGKSMIETMHGTMMNAWSYIMGLGQSRNTGGNQTAIPAQSSSETTTSGGNSSFLGSIQSGINIVTNEAQGWAATILSKVFNLGGGGPISTSSSALLNPYRLMYILEGTNKKYSFPMLDKSASSFRVSNKMDEKNDGVGTKLLGNALFDTIANLGQTVLGFAQDLEQIAPFFSKGAKSSGSNMKQYSIERSKYFSYPTDGEEIEISFLLYNTIQKNIWKKHYRFILGFMMRNLPFKQDVVSYYPPLFYDVIVPGVKRCPFCYVETFDVKPLGLMRSLKMSAKELNFAKIATDTVYSVNVPEAWMVSIKFKSLLGFSGNQILSGFFDTPITASVK